MQPLEFIPQLACYGTRSGLPPLLKGFDGQVQVKNEKFFIIRNTFSGWGGEKINPSSGRCLCQPMFWQNQSKKRK
ncbi:MAG: hypothetical protein DRP69_03950 [Candidatus Duberdicusella sinuisediminis]|nr:MAG: hypothetical protein DRP69_03950 [Candidatus Omnitrophota bacterium]